jgi:hypothetical protein
MLAVILVLVVGTIRLVGSNANNVFSAVELKDTFGSLDLAIGTYRRSVSKIIPEMTRVALLTKRTDIVRDTPNFSEKKFLYRLSRTEYQREWGADYKKPGPGAS